MDDDETLQEAKRALGTVALSEETVRFTLPACKPPALLNALQSSQNRQLVTCIVKANKDLGDSTAERSTIFIDMEPQVRKLRYDYLSLHIFLASSPARQRESADFGVTRLKSKPVF